MIIGSNAFIVLQIFFHHYYIDAFKTKDIFKKSYTFLQYSSRASLIRYRDFNYRIHPQTNTIYLKHRSYDYSLLTRVKLDEVNTLKRLCLRVKRVRESAASLIQEELGAEKKNNEARKEEDNYSTIINDNYEISPILPKGDPLLSKSISEESNTKIIQNDDDSNTDGIGTYDTLLARNCLTVQESAGKGKGLFTTVNIEEGIDIGANIYVHCILGCISYM
jgi:hypothetical protein